jgi:hypothetical protein
LGNSDRFLPFTATPNFSKNLQTVTTTPDLSLENARF